MRNKKRTSPFNMSVGFIPLIICMILSEFISYGLSIYAATGIGLVYALGAPVLHKKNTPNFILYVSTGILLILSVTTFFFGNIFPKKTLSFILEMAIAFGGIILFYHQNKLIGFLKKKPYCQCDEATIFRMDTTRTALRILFLITLIHLIITTFFLIISSPLGDMTNNILFHITPPVVLIVSMAINQIGIRLLYTLDSEAEIIPIVNEQGDVVGRRSKLDAFDYKNAFINPVIRIAIISKGMLFLCCRKRNCVVEKCKMDVPFECYVRYNEPLEKAVDRLLKEVFPSDSKFSTKFNLKYHYKDEETNRLIYLYIANVEDQNILCNKRFIGGKLWTLQQIEDNLGKNYFSKCFELEYEHLKSTITIWEEYK